MKLPSSILPRNLLTVGSLLIVPVLACTLSTKPTEAPGQNAVASPAVFTQVFLPTVTANNRHNISEDLIQPSDLNYLGAFLLPDDGDRPLTFEYGGNAMTYRPGADSDGDGLPGTLFITGHDRLAYGELPNGSQVAEINIPAPVPSKDLTSLNIAEFVQPFSDVTAGHFANLDEIPRIGLAYLDHPATGPLIHIAWGQHMPPDPAPATHGWVNTDLSTPNFQGEWFIGAQDFNSVNGYLFEIPPTWADEYASGKPLATGRYRDGGWSGMGLSLYAYQPWTDTNGSPEASGTRLQETVLLQYESSYNTANIERCLNGYQHPDEWEGGEWLTTSSAKTALIFAGTKSIGAKYWYGFVNPAGPQYPCVAGDFVGEFTVCYQADGSPCPERDLTECSGHNDMRGWWSTGFEAQIIFYDPADLARVAVGELESWQPQPYATLNLEPWLFHNPDNIEPEMLGVGVQRRMRIGAIAFDRANGLLYILELFSEGAKPVVHVFRIN